MNHALAVQTVKQFRKSPDEVLQDMKEFRETLIAHKEEADLGERFGEVIAQHTIAIRDLESAIMREGMTLKHIGTPTPYPESYNPDSPVVHPTADGLTL